MSHEPRDAMKQGVSFVCAHCQWYWVARDRFVRGAQCASPGPCGGPLSGREFPHYLGVLSEWSNLCFVCGAAPSLWVKPLSGSRLFGLCAAHKPYLTELVPHDGIVPFLEVRLTDGRVVTQADLRARGKTLREVIAEYEAECSA